MKKIILACLLAFLLALYAHGQFFDTRTYAAGLGKDLYGIAAGDSLEKSSTNINQYLDDYKNLGAQWVRFDFDWVDIQSGGKTSYNWSRYDEAVAAANARGIKVLGIITYTPQWELPTGCTNLYNCPPKSTADFTHFAATVTARYAPKGVHYWEIWNEPNVGKRFTAAAYTRLLKSVYPAIKNADSGAFVLTGGTAPAITNGTDISPIDFLTGIYQNGGKKYFDAVAHHPYCFSPGFNCPKSYADWSAWSQMQDTHLSLRSVMIANGDQNKKIWATEFGAPTGGGSQAVSEAQQAQMVTDAYSLFNSYSWSGPLFWYTYKDPCTTTTNLECFFGLVRPDFSQKPAYAAYKGLAAY